MTGAGAPGAAGIHKCLVQDIRFNIIAADANPHAVGRWLVDDFERIPRAGEEDFIVAILNLCRRKNVHVLLPLVTRELIPLSRHRSEFELAGAKLLTMETSILEIANDKAKLYQFLQSNGIPVPEFRVVDTLEQFERAVNELGYPGKTICFKPSVSNGSRGFRIISEVVDEHALLFNEKPGSTYISLSDARRILSLKLFPQLLVSQFLPGKEYSVDCLADNGDPLIIVPRLRRKMINGISVEGEFINDAAIIEYCNHIISLLKLHGNTGIQLRCDDNGKPLILEINPRVQGSISAGLGAGINLPILGIKQALGLPILPEELQVIWGTKFSRYWNEVFYQ
jgi:carbamoyl-phosphate synthase large subunit